MPSAVSSCHEAPDNFYRAPGWCRACNSAIPRVWLMPLILEKHFTQFALVELQNCALGTIQCTF